MPSFRQLPTILAIASYASLSTAVAHHSFHAHKARQLAARQENAAYQIFADAQAEVNAKAASIASEYSASVKSFLATHGQPGPVKYEDPVVMATPAQAPAETTKATTATPKKSAPAATATAYTNTDAPAAASCYKHSDVVRGVNLGGWLIVEGWMLNCKPGSLFYNNTQNPQDPPGVFLDIAKPDQWHTDEYAQQNADARKALVKHWDTFITKDDIAALPSYGINTVRIPIGYWAFTPKDTDNTPYVRWGILPETKDYLKQAIDWCKAAGLRVMIDLHGSMLSQNGKEHSGQIIDPWPGTDAWLDQSQTVDILVELAKTYTTPEYKDTVFAIEMTNEPQYCDRLKAWTISTFHAIRDATKASNPNLKIIMHDAFYGAQTWQDVATDLNGPGTGKDLADLPFWLDLHLYQNQGGTVPGSARGWSDLNAADHAAEACNWANNSLEPSTGNTLPIIIGEFSAQINLCQNRDTGVLTAAKDCVGNCACTWSDMDEWTPELLGATRDFMRAQMQTFEKHSRGWMLWNLKTDSGESPWSFLALVKEREGFGQVVETPVCQTPKKLMCE